MRRLCKLGIALLLFALAVHSQSPAPRLFTETRPAMGTKFTIHLFATDERKAAEYFQLAFDEIERIEEVLSNYRPSSELSRINRRAAQEAVTTDPEVFALLQLALDYSRRSDGAFDITVGPLLRAWGFFRGEGRYPSAEELAKARAVVGWQNVQLDSASRTVRFRVAGVELDPGGIGKGYAVDRVIGLLREAGVQSALVDAGSSTMLALGAPPGEDGWRVQIPRPANRTQSVSSVLLRDNSLSTSGSYEKFFRLEGRTYCHIFDPRTGEPVQEMLQTTVIASDATTSDVLSTAMFVMGPAAGKELLQSVPNAKVLWIQGEPQAPQLVTWRWPDPVPSSVSSLRQSPRRPLAVRKFVQRRSFQQ
jgi:thiamine biosynthesis lipoprotein